MISIILINYYSSHFIKKTIGSLKAQNIPIEIIVLDNSENDLEANALKNEKNIRIAFGSVHGNRAFGRLFFR